MSKVRVRKIESIPTPPQGAGRDLAVKWFNRFLPVAIFLWPFVYLYPFIVAINGNYRGIGNDFVFYYKYKVYLLAGLANFHFPLWSPSEAAGYPFAISPFAQAFYPLNILLLAFYKLAGGYNPIDHQIFTVLAIAIFATGLFAWLKQLNNNLRAVIFATLIMSVSFKVTEIMRFTTAIHTAAWYPWILYALTRIMLNTSVKQTVLYGTALVFFVFCQVSGAYPYYFYYDQFLFVPYLLIFFIKPLRIRLFGDRPIHFKRAIITLAASGLAIALTCGPYLLAVIKLMAETADRSGKSFAFSVHHVFGYQGTIGSLIFPPAAQAEGWYFFGITALLIIILSFCRRPAAADLVEDSRQPQFFSDYWGIAFFLLWIGGISYITYGAHSYLFKFLWYCWPGFSGLRVWGRLNIILVPIIAWLLSLAYASYESMISSNNATSQNRLKRLLPIGIVIVFYAAILPAQLYMYHHKIFDQEWGQYFENVASNDILFIIFGAAAFGAVLIPLIISRWVPLKSGLALAIVLVCLAAVNVIEMRHVGTNMWSAPATAESKRLSINIDEFDAASFSYPRLENRSMVCLNPLFNVIPMGNWHFNRYVTFLEKTENEDQVRRILLGVQDGRKIFFSKSIDYTTVRAFLNDAVQYPNTGRMISYNGDELQWEIVAPVAGYLSFIDNWDYGWKAYVDNKPADIQLLFETFKSVHLTAGFHRIRFSYEPSLLRLKK